jgi:hypothetical protein
MEAYIPKSVIYLIANHSMPGLVKLGLTVAGIDEKRQPLMIRPCPQGFDVFLLE